MMAKELICLAGWLRKRVAVFGIKAKRWCILNYQTFFVFVEERSEFPEITLTITNQTKIEYKATAKMNKLIVWNSDKENIELFADSSEELMRWVTVIKNAPLQTMCLSMDDFVVIRTLGRGYYGSVLLVSKKDTKEKFAIKSINKRKLAQGDATNTAVAERNILLKASHPFIVHLKFAFQSPQNFFLGLEFASGGELFTHVMENKGLDVQEVKFYLSEIVLSLSYLHSLGIVYRDLKPENVLLDRNGHIKLTDFGLSKEVEGMNRASTFCGTYEYLAPEIVLRKPYGYEIDWWSVGIIAYEMVLQRTPFADKSQAKMLDKIVKEEVQFPINFDESLQDLISALLVKDPKSRAGFQDIVNHDFFNGVIWKDVFERKVTPLFIPRETTVETNDDSEGDEIDIDSEGKESYFETRKFPGFSFTGIIEKNGDSYDLTVPKELLEV